MKKLKNENVFYRLEDENTMYYAQACISEVNERNVKTSFWITLDRFAFDDNLNIDFCFPSFDSLKEAVAFLKRNEKKIIQYINIFISQKREMEDKLQELE